MRSVQYPSPVRSALVLEDLESGLQAWVVCESELCDEVKPNQDVVVDVVRIVESEPRDVFSPFLEQSSFQIELSSSRDGMLNLPGSFRLWQTGKGGHGLPAVQRSGRALGTVPTPILPLIFEHPIIQLPHPVVVPVTETGQQTSSIPDGAHLLGEDVDHRPQLELVLEEAIRDLSDPRVARSEAQVGENEGPPGGGDVLRDAEKVHPVADVRRLMGFPEPFRFLESQYVPGPTDSRYLGMSLSHFGVVFLALQQVDQCVIANGRLVFFEQPVDELRIPAVVPSIARLQRGGETSPIASFAAI